jgi:hypothetical protein
MRCLLVVGGTARVAVAMAVSVFIKRGTSFTR